MDEDRPEDTSPPPDSGRAKRPPPTIDLEASEVSGETQGTDAGARRAAEAILPAVLRPGLRPRRFPRRSTAAVTGAVTAALVIAIAWVVGWPGETAPPTRLRRPMRVRSKRLRPASPISRRGRPGLRPQRPTRRWLRGLTRWKNPLHRCARELAGARAQSEKLAAELNAVKSAPREAASPPDLAAINERLSQIERAARAESAESAQQDNKPADDARASPRRRGVHARRFGSAGRAFRRRSWPRRNRSRPIRTR